MADNWTTERKAIFDTARLFTEYGWIFREQPIVDKGIDALVETPMDANGRIKVFALQIKGGESNFHRRKDYITFYFSQKHYKYWNARSENNPLFIILQDPVTRNIYWQYYHHRHIAKTSKNWKLTIPCSNILNENSKKSILEILYEQQRHSETERFVSTQVQTEKNGLHISFYLSSETNNSLHVLIEFKNDSVKQNLNYRPEKKEWELKKSFLNWASPYYYSLIGFQKHIQVRFEKTKRNKQAFHSLINEVKKICEHGMEGIAEFIFNHENQQKSIPKYSEFKRAFELHSKLKKNQYQTIPLGSIIHFKTKKNTFEMSTYESLTAHLESYFKNYSYDEIYTQTNENIWSEIYVDPGIEKSKFIPVMQNEWERYWKRLYITVEKEVGSTDHLDSWRDESWRTFKSLIDVYNDAESVIKLAYDFDEMILYPMAVITMLKIYDPKTCYLEYCEYEFYASGEWESIVLDEDKEDFYDSPIFFIKPYDFA